jgi:hypothetical protein
MVDGCWLTVESGAMRAPKISKGFVGKKLIKAKKSH